MNGIAYAGKWIGVLGGVKVTLSLPLSMHFTPGEPQHPAFFLAPGDFFLPFMANLYPFF